MKTLIFGRPTRPSIEVATRAVSSLGVTKILVLVQSGLAVEMMKLAASQGLPVGRYGPDLKAHRHKAIEIAIDQMLRFEGHLTAICLNPRGLDLTLIRHLGESGVSVAVGRIQKDRSVEWTQVPAYCTPRSSVPCKQYHSKYFKRYRQST